MPASSGAEDSAPPIRTTSGLRRQTTVAITSPNRRPASWVSRAAGVPSRQQLAHFPPRVRLKAQRGQLGRHRAPARHSRQAALHAALTPGV